MSHLSTQLMQYVILVNSNVYFVSYLTNCQITNDEDEGINAVT